jgi:hypothetical protein
MNEALTSRHGGYLIKDMVPGASGAALLRAGERAALTSVLPRSEGEGELDEHQRNLPEQVIHLCNGAEDGGYAGWPIRYVVA